jgi:hypothetical protein
MQGQAGRACRCLLPGGRRQEGRTAACEKQPVKAVIPFTQRSQPQPTTVTTARDDTGQCLSRAARDRRWPVSREARDRRWPVFASATGLDVWTHTLFFIHLASYACRFKLEVDYY